MAITQLSRSLSPSILSSISTRANCLNSALRSLQSTTRAFSSSPRSLDWLAPKAGESSKSRKGRPHVATGGSTRGTTLVWGDYGLRLRDHDRRVSASQLKIADATIRQRLRGLKYRLYHRVSANIGVYTSGNDQRMGKGKGSFDYWCARVGVSKVLFELKGDVHEAVVRDAMRIAGNKLPGVYEFVRKGDLPVMGITKVRDAQMEEALRRPRMEAGVTAALPSLEATAEGMSATSAP
ncbi:39S ribosomal protein L16, mitochondrial [Teratosphaeriaceae sp. CCFEE 6253]|nr:39S ribosomal protein L16, mitochondrial [Teratosphaeriaceae sp. CCFEE 6253]